MERNGTNAEYSKVHRSASPGTGFLGMSDVHECPVGFKWLLFVAFEAQMDHYWGHLGVSVTDGCLAHH